MALISGIQQIGIGCEDANKTFTWLRKTFGLNVKIFDDEANAALMTTYTGGEIHARRAILAMNMNGGGGAEIWRFTSRTPDAGKKVNWGDYGINAVKFKSTRVENSHALINENNRCTQPQACPSGNLTFLLNDDAGNQYQVVKDPSWFKSAPFMQGGICGALIGVSNMEASIAFYQKGFGLNHIDYDVTGQFIDLGEDATKQTFRRVLLSFKNPFIAPFSRLLGDVQIELIQALDRKAAKVYENRYWGDVGFIHLCFDVADMTTLKANLQKNNYAFTVDSGDTFDMGESGGRFGYVEDPDGTLIEMVETHKVPILKKMGLFLNLKNRKSGKPLPNWMVSLMGLNKVKD
jgi:catechol 2,3-dioxygenase-like lactoylglutathione lyase family enzyme